MKAIDLQCMAVTPWGSLAAWQANEYGSYFGSEMYTDKGDEEMAQVLRKADVKAMMVLPATAMVRDDIGKVKAIHDRAYQFKKDYADVVIGFWAVINPHLGYRGLQELERCLKDLQFVGYYYATPAADIPMNDKRLYYFYDLCRQAGVPVRINIGHTAHGAGQPGGRGFRLATERPIPYFDDICADFPDLTVIAAHPAWPWTDEIISILLHKGNAYAENHGWAPKHVPEAIKREINGRLQDKYLFGSGFPELRYERVFAEWESAGLKPEVLEKMYYKNAQRVFGLAV